MSFYFQDDEFDTMIKAGEKIERLYAHWFDMVIENEDLIHITYVFLSTRNYCQHVKFFEAL